MSGGVVRFDSFSKKPPRARRFGLFAKIEALDELVVALGRRVLQVVEETAAAGHHFQQAAAGRMVLGVPLEVFGQKIDALGQARNLHVRASGVFLMQRHAAYGGLGHIGNRGY